MPTLLRFMVGTEVNGHSWIIISDGSSCMKNEQNNISQKGEKKKMKTNKRTTNHQYKWSHIK